MCCDLCDHYYSCEEVEKMKLTCCVKCEEFADWHGEAKAAGRRADGDEDLDDDDADEDLDELEDDDDSDDEDDDFDDFDEEELDDDEEDDEDEEYFSGSSQCRARRLTLGRPRCKVRP